MTRDTQRPHGDRDSASDADVYTALWAAATLPRLPIDAPNELKKLTIDIDDPKRVYVIHRASRRHNFQTVVERYILQIRYGCKSNSCTTSTCFSCRKRLAASAGAPVRRYNATSARILAVYLASQDNPEHGLCHNPSAERPTSSIGNGLKQPTRRGSVDGKDAINRNGLRDDRLAGNDSPKLESQTTTTSRRVSPGDTAGRHAEMLKEEAVKTRRTSIVDVLDDRTTIDHRSFVQNVFGTVAFKMLEWLTPRNLDILARSAAKDAMPREECTKSPDPPQPLSSGRTIIPETAVKMERREDASNLLLDGQSDIHDSKATSGSAPASQIVASSKPVAAVAGEAKATTFVDSRQSASPTTTSIPVPNHRKWPDPTESQLPKGILNVSASPKASETVPDIRPLSRDRSNSKPKRRMSRPGLVTSPTMRVGQLAPLHAIQSPPIRETPNAKPKVIENQESEKLTRKEDPHNTCDFENALRNPSRQTENIQPPPAKNVALPQSLSRLTIEAIEFICDILQLDNTCEDHFLQPHNIGENLKRRQTHAILKRNSGKLGPVAYPASLKRQWLSFVEQGFFDTLCKPESLLQSFRDDEKKLFDTQTLWYLMLRMTRVAPSLVFDSLWNVAGTLFQPPEKLESTYDWAKETNSPGAVSNKAVSSVDAAQIMNICLHALIASAPLVSDTRQLANMSRIRSYGLTTLGRGQSSALEPVTLCLHYDDAFTNDSALRLARRLFAAIPTRRRYTDLLELQQEIRRGEKREPDVLETVLDTLKCIGSGTSPMLNFSDNEQDLHEKRVPTLILDWARTVMLQDWEASAEVPSDGPFGGALAMIAAIYKNRKSLLLGDIHFRTEYFAERLDPVEMPLEWLNFSPNKKTVHLLDYPYLFNPSTLVTYFRAINYSRMNQAYETARDKEALIRHVVGENRLGEARLMADEDCQQKLYGRLKTATARFMMLEIRRTHVLLDAFNSIWRREERELMRPLKVRLGEEDGEQGMDIGGVQQEFFRLAIAEALNPAYGAFTIDSRTKMTWFQPGSPEPLWKFQLIGMIVSLAVYNGLNLPVTFPKALYMKLLDEEVSELHHIADGWPDLANGLTMLLEWDEKNGLVEDVFTRTYEFSVEQFGQPISLEMGTGARTWPQFSDSKVTSHMDAPLVTNSNRNGYVSDYIRWLTDISIQPQFDAFKRGFFACIDRRSITLFDPDTLQSVVEGVQEIDISEMRRATRYVGWEASNRTVRDFWSIVKRYDMDQKKKLLEFVTASDRVPVGGMRNLQFTLQKNGVGDGHLPSSYTCFGILLLPEYSSKEVLRQNLTTALENSMGFGFA